MLHLFSFSGDNYQSLHTNSATQGLVLPLASLSVAAVIIILFGTCKVTMPVLQERGCGSCCKRQHVNGDVLSQDEDGNVAAAAAATGTAEEEEDDEGSKKRRKKTRRRRSRSKEEKKNAAGEEEFEMAGTSAGFVC